MDKSILKFLNEGGKVLIVYRDDVNTYRFDLLYQGYTHWFVVSPELLIDPAFSGEFETMADICKNRGE